jgi:hypothetical protein
MDKITKDTVLAMIKNASVGLTPYVSRLYNEEFNDHTNNKQKQKQEEQNQKDNDISLI